MKVTFLYTTEISFIGSEESVICGIEIDGRTIDFTGAMDELERFGISAEEMAKFAADGDSVHFEREMLSCPVRGTRLNDKTSTEEISVLTVSVVANSEVIKTTQLSRVVCSW